MSLLSKFGLAGTKIILSQKYIPNRAEGLSAYLKSCLKDSGTW